ncbi:MAG: aspartyl protease family protein [Cyclobacteriaceae bacterium]
MYFSRLKHGFIPALLLAVLLQCQTRAAEYAKIFSLISGQQSTQIPFQLLNNMIVIPVKVGGDRVLNFVLDTGTASPLILNERYLKGLDFKKNRKIKFTGAGMGEQASGHVVVGLSLQVGDALASTIGMLVLDKNPLSHLKLEETLIHGIMGTTLFRSFTVEIDYLTQTIILHENNDLFTQEAYVAFPLNLEYSKPMVYAHASYGDSEHYLQLMLDTGFNGKLLIYPTTREKLNMEAQMPHSSFGLGYSGRLSLPQTKVRRFQLGNYHFFDVETLLPHEDTYRAQAPNASMRDGIIGNELLRNFCIVLDYAGSTLYIRQDMTDKEAEILASKKEKDIAKPVDEGLSPKN